MTLLCGLAQRAFHKLLFEKLPPPGLEAFATSHSLVRLWAQNFTRLQAASLVRQARYGKCMRAVHAEAYILPILDSFALRRSLLARIAACLADPFERSTHRLQASRAGHCQIALLRCLQR